MRRVAIALGSALLALGCVPAIDEGHFQCTRDDECPSGWTCRGDGRCWSSPGADHDAGADAGADAGTDGGTDGGADACVPAPRPVDLLVMVDNSNSMAEEQVALTTAFPELVRALATGDVEADGIRDFDPVSDLRVGVVSSDMGTAGFAIPTCALPALGDDGILRTLGSRTLTGCSISYPSFLEFAADGELSTFRNDFRCVATLGTGGCGIEQQLDSVLKALTPSDSALTFIDGAGGQGDPGGANAGFLRDDSVLVVLLVTDEDDCSVADPALFDPAGPYAATNLNLRCGRHPEALHPFSRYADGLRALRPGHPERLVFAALTGVPPAIETSDYRAILASPDMEPTEDPDFPGRYRPVCETVDGSALPARRIVETARELLVLGSGAMIRSICRPNFEGPFRQLLTLITPRLVPSCE